MDLMALSAKISLDASQLEQGLREAEKLGQQSSKKMEESLGKTEGRLKRFFSGFAENFKVGTAEQFGRSFAEGLMSIPGKIKDVFSQAMSLAGELEQNVGGAQAVFGDYFDELQTVAANAYKNVGLSQSKYLSEANKMGSLLQGMGFSQKQSMEMTVDIMQRASDVASIMGISVEDAMRAVEGAAKGNFTMMDNLGVAINETALKTYAAQKGMDENAIKNMDTQQKIALAFDLFMQKTSQYAGNYDKENSSLAGSANSFKAAWEDFLAGANDGYAVAAMGEKALKSLWTTAMQLIPKLWESTKNIAKAVWPKFTQWLGTAVKKLPTVLGRAFTTGANGLIDIVNSVFGTNIPKLKIEIPDGATLQEAAQIVWDGLVEWVADLGGLVFGRDEEGKVKWPDLNTLKTAALTLWGKLKGWIADLGGLIFGRDEKGEVNWPDLNTLKTAALTLWGKLKGWIADLGGMIFGRDKNGEVNWPNLNTLKSAALTLWGKLKGWIADLGGMIFGRDETGEVNWPDLGTLKTAALTLWGRLKGWIADLGGMMFGRDTNGEVNWPDWNTVSDAAGKAWELIKAGAAKLGGLVFGKAEDGSVAWPSWKNIQSSALKTWAKIKNAFYDISSKTKIKIARMLGMTNESGEAVDDGDDVSWKNVAQSILDKLRSKFNEITTASKIKIAKLLGLTDENGNAVDDGDSISWKNIAQNILDKLRGKFTEITGATKIKLANLLGLTDASGNAIDDGDNVSWKNIAQNVLNKISGKISELTTATKIKLANLLGLTDANGAAVDDGDDVSWANIAGSIKQKIIDGMNQLGLKLMDILKIDTTDAGGTQADWVAIGRSITGKLAGAIDQKGGFIKQLILGDEYNDKSTWLDVVHKISGWITDEFGEGGLINALLGNAAEIATAAATIAGLLLTGVFDWIGDHTTEFVGIIAEIAGALAQAAGPIIDALISIISDPKFMTAIAGLVSKIMEALSGGLTDAAGMLLFGKEGWEGMVQQGIIKGRKASGSYKEGDEEWNKWTAGVDKKYGLDGKYPGDPAGYRAATMWQIGLTQGIPSWWQESSWIDNLADLKKLASESGNRGLYEQASAGIQAFGKAWAKGLRGEDVLNAVKEAMGEVGDGVDFSPEVTLPDDSAKKLQKILDSFGLSVNVGVNPQVNAEGSFAKGLNYVPYNGYLAELHRGEQVLTASQARHRGEGEETSGLAAMVGDLKTTLAHLRIQVGEKEFGSTVADYGSARVRQHINGFNRKRRMGYGSI